MSDEPMERLISAFERIASSMERWCNIEQARFDKDYPPPTEIQDAEVFIQEKPDEPGRPTFAREQKGRFQQKFEEAQKDDIGFQ